MANSKKQIRDLQKLLAIKESIIRDLTKQIAILREIMKANEPIVTIPTVFPADTCINGLPHDFPPNYVGDFGPACRRCGKMLGWDTIITNGDPVDNASSTWSTHTVLCGNECSDHKE